MNGLENWPAIFVGFVGARKIIRKRMSLLLPRSAIMAMAKGVLADLMSGRWIWWPSLAVVNDWP